MTDSADFEPKRLKDARMAILVTEYLEICEQELGKAQRIESAAEGKPPRSYSLAHYESREVQDLGARRAEVLSTLKSEGMPTGHWVGYGNRAVLLDESPPGYPRSLTLYDALWEVLEEASEDTPPIEIARASRRLEFRRSLSAARRFLFDIYTGDIALPGRSEFSALPIAALILVVCVLSVLLSAGLSTGTIISAGLVTAFASLLVIGELTSAARGQQARLVAELRAREAGRSPEPEELVYVGGREARVEYPAPDKESPVHEGMFDVRFLADGSRARVKADDLRPVLSPAPRRGCRTPARAVGSAGRSSGRLTEAASQVKSKQ